MTGKIVQSLSDFSQEGDSDEEDADGSENSYTPPFIANVRQTTGVASLPKGGRKRKEPTKPPSKTNRKSAPKSGPTAKPRAKKK
jgi:hypothetical protein